MLNLSSIVVASDLTERSTIALRRAMVLKQKLAAQLTLLHVIDTEAVPAGSLDSYRQHAAALLQTQLSSVCNDERHCWLKVVDGERDATIVEEAQLAGADLIVLGDIHKPGWREGFLGTTTERVVRMSERPVLMVRGITTAGYRRVFCAFDGSLAACNALVVGLTLANEAQCLVVHASETPMLVAFATQGCDDTRSTRQANAMTAALQSCLERVGRLRVRPQFRIIDGNAHFLIRQQISAFEPDLVAIGIHSRSAVATAFLGSVARDVLADSDCDILIAPSNCA